MEALYHETNALIEEVDSRVGKMEKADGHSTGKELLQKLDRAMISCERLYSMVVKEPETRQASAQMRVNQLKYDCLHIRAAINSLQQKRWQQQQAEGEQAMLGNNSSGRREGPMTPDSIGPAPQHRSRATAARSFENDQQTGEDPGSSQRGHSAVQEGFPHRTDQDGVVLGMAVFVACAVMFCVWFWFV